MKVHTVAEHFRLSPRALEKADTTQQSQSIWEAFEALGCPALEGAKRRRLLPVDLSPASEEEDEVVKREGSPSAHCLSLVNSLGGPKQDPRSKSHPPIPFPKHG